MGQVGKRNQGIGRLRKFFPSSFALNLLCQYRYWSVRAVGRPIGKVEVIVSDSGNEGLSVGVKPLGTATDKVGVVPGLGSELF